MAAFIAKQVVGKKLESVKDALGDKDDKKSDAEQDEAAIAEARKEAEERRKEKHRKMEEDREKMRQEIRDKYGLKKRELDASSPTQEDGRPVRKKCSTSGLPAEQDGVDEESSVFPKGLSNLPEKVAGGKCVLQ
jgi:complexin-1/2